MSFTVNNSVNNTGTSNTAVTVSISISSGHTVGVLVYSDGPTSFTVADSSGTNTYTARNSLTAAFGQFSQAFTAVAVGSALTSVTATGNAAGSFISVTVFDLTATGTISYADSGGTDWNFNNPATTDGTTSPLLSIGSASSGLLLGQCQDPAGGTVSTGTGFTAGPTNFAGSVSEYKAVSASARATFTDTPANQRPQVMALLFTEASAGGVTVNVPLGTLALSGKVPTVTATANQSIAVPLGTLTLSGKVPTVLTPVAIAVPAGSLSLTAQTPTVAITANQNIAVPAGALSITGFAPTVVTSGSVTINVPSGTLSLTAQTPTVQATANQSIAVPAGTLTLTGLAPTVSVGSNIAIAVPAGSLSLTAQTPTVAVSNNQQISVPLGQLVLNGLAPTIGLTQNVNIDVPLGQLTLTAFAPQVGGVVVASQPGPLDSPRIAEGHYRTRKKRAKARREQHELVEPTQPVFIAPASLEHEIKPEIAQSIERTSLAQLTAVESLRQELDDEEAMEWILKVLD